MKPLLRGNVDGSPAELFGLPDASLAFEIRCLGAIVRGEHQRQAGHRQIHAKASPATRDRAVLTTGKQQATGTRHADADADADAEWWKPRGRNAFEESRRPQDPAAEQAGGDPHVWDNEIGGFTAHVSGLSVNPAVQMAGPGTAIGSLAATFGYPGAQIGDTRGALFGPNLAVSAVPEPPTWLLMLGAAALLAARARPGAGTPT